MSDETVPQSLVWIRKIRDEHYERTKHLPLTTFDEDYFAEGLRLAEEMGLDLVDPVAGRTTRPGRC